MVGPSYTYLFVPRDERWLLWHKSYWVGIPEWARDKMADGVYRIDDAYGQLAVSLLLAYFDEATVHSYDEFDSPASNPTA